ncbi:terminase small subunit [Clostridium sp. CTA-6]
MARARSPNRDKSFEIYKEHDGNIDLVKIAEILNISPGTVRGWKNKDKWDDKLNGTFQKNSKKNTERSKHKKANKDIKKEKPKDKNNMSLELTELTERQRLFAEEFVKVPIAYKAAVKAGYSPDRAFITGSELVRNRKVKTYIKYLKELKRESLLIDKEDLIDVHMRIAFSDITDFVEFGRERVPVLVKGMPLIKKNPLTGEDEPVTKLVNSVRLKEDFEVDGSLINEVSTGKNGVKIKLYDKQKSLDWLTNYFALNPMDKHKIDFDNAKLKLEEQRNGIAALKFKEDPEEETEDDGFIQALEGTAQEDWLDEEEN